MEFHGDAIRAGKFTLESRFMRADGAPDDGSMKRSGLSIRRRHRNFGRFIIGGISGSRRMYFLCFLVFFPVRIAKRTTNLNSKEAGYPF